MESSPLYQELLSCSFDTIKLHPGLTFDTFCSTMLAECPDELSDIYDSDDAILQGLTTIWNAPYTDPYTSATHTISEWSAIIHDDESLGRYYTKSL